MNRKDWLLINVLSNEFYNDCHLEYSINVPIEKLYLYVKDLERSQEIILYCASNTCPKSKQAWHKLNELGFANVRVYEGGAQEWFHHGFPTKGACALEYLHTPLEVTRSKKVDNKIPTISIIELKAKLDTLVPNPSNKKVLNYQNQKKPSSHLLNYFILIGIMAVIFFIAVIKNYSNLYDYKTILADFMGGYFLFFGAVQFISLPNFVQVFRTYDIVASIFSSYAYIYPLIEIFLAIAYLNHWNLWHINWVTFIFMLISSIGVAHALIIKKQAHCACLGSLLILPISFFTLIENVSMALMALWMNLY